MIARIAIPRTPSRGVIRWPDLLVRGLEIFVAFWQWLGAMEEVKRGSTPGLFGQDLRHNRKAADSPLVCRPLESHRHGSPNVPMSHGR
jgi:hypothetical protein